MTSEICVNKHEYSPAIHRLLGSRLDAYFAPILPRDLIPLLHQCLVFLLQVVGLAETAPAPDADPLVQRVFTKYPERIARNCQALLAGNRLNSKTSTTAPLTILSSISTLDVRLFTSSDLVLR